MAEMISQELIRSAIEISKKTNSVETTMTFHQMKDFDDWCLRVTVCKHHVCETLEKEDK